MVFSSTIFLFAFLPIVLTLYLAPRSLPARNLLQLTASLIFSNTSNACSLCGNATYCRRSWRRRSPRW